MSGFAVVFPGQGTQHVGMGGDLWAASEKARAVFSQAGRVLGRDIAGLCREGPQSELDRTVNTQISVFICSIAAYEVFRELAGFDPRVAAGHSLGEYAAIFAAGALGIEDLAAIVRDRGERHENAYPPGQGKMAAIIGLDEPAVARLCAEMSAGAEVVDIANLNAANQTVVSGHAAGVARVLAAAVRAGAKKTAVLPISVPCHSRLMEEAARLFRGDLDRVSFREFRIPVIPNFDPDALYSPDTAKNLLWRQIVSPVRWHEAIRRIADMGIDTIVEIGPKRVLSGLVPAIDKRIRPLYGGNDAASVEKCAQAIRNSVQSSGF
jgi:[acyl-carrier-protein] S-malonyltransferase